MAAKVKIPFANIPRTKKEALLQDTPNIKVLATVSTVIRQVFHEFLNKEGKYRRYTDSFEFAKGYALDADVGRGETQIYFRILNQELEKITPSIQVILGHPMPQDDLNTGYERGRLGAELRKAYERHYYTLNSLLVVAGHSGTVASELGLIANRIVTRHIPQIFSGVITSSESNWQLGFPHHLEVTDQVSRREEIRGEAYTQIHYVEWTMPLMFEELVLLGNPPDIGQIVQYAPEHSADPYWEGPGEIRMGVPTTFLLKGRMDATPETVGVTDPTRARIRKVSMGVYELLAVRPGDITLQALYPVGLALSAKPALLDIKLTR